MKKFFTASLFALVLGAAAVAQDKKVAVFDPAGSSVDEFLKEIVREEISAIIVNTGSYTVLERSLINKVLEENKFQAGGLVDDSQVSEIGKRMGANMVFVSSLTQMSNRNLYISFKMIDVQTARIEKQKTAQTSRGADDLVTMVQKTVGEMFAKSQRVSENSRQQSRTIVEGKSAPLVLDGKKIFMNGMELDKQEVQEAMLNTDALRYYNEGISRSRKGNILLVTGGICILSGALTLGIARAGERDAFLKEGGGYLLSAIGIVGGSSMVIGGFTLKAKSKSNIKKSVDMYNRSGKFSSAELRFGATRHGVGLVLNF